MFKGDHKITVFQINYHNSYSANSLVREMRRQKTANPVQTSNSHIIIHHHNARDNQFKWCKIPIGFWIQKEKHLSEYPSW